MYSTIKNRSVALGCLLYAWAFLLLVINSNVYADDCHELKLTVPHYNYDDYPDKGSAAISAWMSMISLEPAGYPDRPTLQEVYDYGRSIQASGPFNHDTVSRIMNNFETDPDYYYGVVHDTDFDSFISRMAYWINRPIPDVPVNKAPIMIPLHGTYEDWVVVTGARSLKNPYVYPDTIMYGFWVDDPKMYDFDEDEEPVETNIYYTVENLEISHIDGEYFAVVPKLVPSPGSLALLISGLIGLAITFRVLPTLRR